MRHVSRLQPITLRSLRIALHSGGQRSTEFQCRDRIFERKHQLSILLVWRPAGLSSFFPRLKR